jgi:hypothetical protein
VVELLSDVLHSSLHITIVEFEDVFKPSEDTVVLLVPANSISPERRQSIAFPQVVVDVPGVITSQATGPTPSTAFIFSSVVSSGTSV